jgi:Flp pilus assembly pilin Flp
MRAADIRRDERGATAVEFALTAPLFFALLFGAIEGGLLMWSQIGIQHGAEMAARCAGIKKPKCLNESAIQYYAAQEAYGLNPPPSTFTVTAAACGTQITGSYDFALITTYFGTPKITLSAKSCFP